MRIYDIIAKKRDGFPLDDEEIAFFVKGFTNGDIKNYHAAALLMAIHLNGMDDREMTTLTIEMAHSGDMLDLSEIDGVTADKHSTGGVGDKTTLIVAPIVASLGLKVAKMSGRGLGHTGGTVDKLESIDGFRVSLPGDEFIENVKKWGICVVGQTASLAPADKKIYSLRDSTATVGNIPLIASSIMSKKLACGSKCIVLDVKCGSGAFMKTPDDAKSLSEKMVTIGKNAGRLMAALITDMDTPLGKNIGNTLEIAEAVDVLKGNGSEDLREVSLQLAANLISLGKGIPVEQAYALAVKALDDGSAFKKFREFIAAQGGNTDVIDDTQKLPKAKFSHNVTAPCDGYIYSMNAESVGAASVILGAGRETPDDTIDYTAGIVLEKKTGDKVAKGETIAVLYTCNEATIASAEKRFIDAVVFSTKKPQAKPLIYEVVR